MKLSKILDKYGNLFYINLGRINCILSLKSYRGCILYHEGYTIHFNIDANELIEELNNKDNQIEV